MFKVAVNQSSSAVRVSFTNGESRSFLTVMKDGSRTLLYSSFCLAELVLWRALFKRE